MGRSVRRARRRVLSLRRDARLASAAPGEAARRQRQPAAGYTSRPRRRCGSHVIASGRRTCSATCRRGSPIQSMEAGRDRSRPTGAITRRRWMSAAPARFRKSTASSTPAGMPRWCPPRCARRSCSTTRARRRSRSSRSSESTSRATALAPASRTAWTAVHRCAGCSTIRSRWPRPISTPTRRPATSSTR